jgi:hypothetical protein
MITDVICGFVAPIYIVWLIVSTGLPFTLFVLFLMYFSFIVLDFFMFACACLATGKNGYWKFWPFMFIYGPFKGYLMRYARLYTISRNGSGRPRVTTTSRRRRSMTGSAGNRLLLDGAGAGRHHDNVA